MVINVVGCPEPETIKYFQTVTVLSTLDGTV